GPAAPALLAIRPGRVGRSCAGGRLRHRRGHSRSGRARRPARRGRGHRSEPAPSGPGAPAFPRGRAPAPHPPAPLHGVPPVAAPRTVVREMARGTRPGGRVGLQDQDFGVVALTHPDRTLTDRIMQGVAEHVYPEPHSGRRLPGLLRRAGLDGVRLLTDVYQDTTLEPWTKTFLERRAERALRFGIVDDPTATRWLDGFSEVVAEGAFVMTLNYYGAVGTKPE